MCKSSKASIGFYLTIWFFSGWVMNRVTNGGDFNTIKSLSMTDRTLVSSMWFAASFGAIQLIEAIIWWGMDSKRPTLVHYATLMIPKALWMQVITQCTWFLWTLFGSAASSSDIERYIGNHPVIAAAIFAFELLSIFAKLWTVYLIGVFLFTNRLDNATCYEGPNGHLMWIIDSMHPDASILLAGTYGPYLYLAGIMLPLLFYGVYGWVLAAYGAATLWYSYKNYSETKEMSSMWCFLAIGYMVLSYVMGTYVLA